MTLLFDSHNEHGQLTSGSYPKIDPFFVKKLFHINVYDFFVTNNKLLRMEVEVLHRRIIFKVY
jgi:hypothetical protein